MSLRMTITVLDLVNDVETLRKVCGFSKSAIANEIGVTRQAYYTWIDGDHTPHGKYEPELVRTILWMQGFVEARERKEKKDAREKARNGDTV